MKGIIGWSAQHNKTKQSTARSHWCSCKEDWRVGEIPNDRSSSLRSSTDGRAQVRDPVAVSCRFRSQVLRTRPVMVDKRTRNGFLANNNWRHEWIYVKLRSGIQQLWSVLVDLSLENKPLSPIKINLNRKHNLGQIIPLMMKRKATKWAIHAGSGMEMRRRMCNTLHCRNNFGIQSDLARSKTQWHNSVHHRNILAQVYARGRTFRRHQSAHTFSVSIIVHCAYVWDNLSDFVVSTHRNDANMLMSMVKVRAAVRQISLRVISPN